MATKAGPPRYILSPTELAAVVNKSHMPLWLRVTDKDETQVQNPACGWTLARA